MLIKPCVVNRMLGRKHTFHVLWSTLINQGLHASRNLCQIKFEKYLLQFGQKFLPFCFVIKTKIKICRIFILPVVFYVYETGCVLLRENID
jgi:hypothetical protein